MTGFLYLDVGHYDQKPPSEIKVIKANLLASDERYGDSPRGNAFENERRQHLEFNFHGSHPQVHFLTSLNSLIRMQR